MNAVLNFPAEAAAMWTDICAVDDILPNTGVCALVEGTPVAVFRVGQSDLYAIDNIDPKNGANVLSRGLVGNLGDRLVVASPLYKHHLDLRTGECLESADWSVRAHKVRADGGRVLVSLS
jgi:nitrite reductase (NADH) small subunit